MSKYLIGLIPSIFILMIACFAKASLDQQNTALETTSRLCTVTNTGITTALNVRE